MGALPSPRGPPAASWSLELRRRDAGTAGGRRQPWSGKRGDQKDHRRCPGGRAAGLGSPRSPPHPGDPGPLGLGLKGESPRVGLGDPSSGARTRPGHRVVPPPRGGLPAGRARPELRLGLWFLEKDAGRALAGVRICGRLWSPFQAGVEPRASSGRCWVPAASRPARPPAVQLIGCDQPPPLPSCSSTFFSLFLLPSVPPFFLSAFLAFFFLFFFNIFHLFFICTFHWSSSSIKLDVFGIRNYILLIFTL